MKTIIISIFLIVGCMFSSAQSIVNYTYSKQGQMISETIQDNYKMNFFYDSEGNIYSKILTNLTGIEHLRADNQEQNYKIYPNPTPADISIEPMVGIAAYEITLCDISGKILQKRSSNQKLTNFSLAAYAEGIYILMLKSENKVSRYKVLKIK